MKKFVALSALGLVAAAGSAFGQGAGFRLDLTMVARTVTGVIPTKTDFQTGGTITSAIPVTYEVEIRYRINDSLSDTTGSRGLLGAQIHVGFVAPGANYSLSRADLSLFQTDKPGNGFNNADNPAAATRNPDATGRTDGGAPGPFNTFSGLHGPFRDGLNGQDSDTGNAGIPDANFPTTDNGTSGGLITAAGFDFVPLALSSPGQNSWAAGANPTTSNTNTNGITWGLFSFMITVTSGTVNMSADAVADPNTGVAYTFYRKIGATNFSDPTESTLHSAGTLQIKGPIVPAPASATLLGLGGLVLARRRRA